MKKQEVLELFKNKGFEVDIYDTQIESFKKTDLISAMDGVGHGSTDIQIGDKVLEVVEDPDDYIVDLKIYRLNEYVAKYGRTPDDTWED